MPDILERLQRALTSRYRIERELGRGGMATVYLAQDLKHDRPVAIKVLDPVVTAAIGPERFLREVKTVARLTHPHILPLHDSGEADGLLFYVMPFVEGESLRARLEREKQLPLDDALRLAREVAGALSYAHGRGVVHRDIKPENVLLEEGHAVVADFGIARAVMAAGGEKLTATGIALGTPAYMSPEQSTGGRDLDGRSDLYSLGCVLYEMLAGVPPFSGPTAESLAHQHLNVSPRPVTELRPGTGPGVAEALSRALAKLPADRFGSARELGEAFEPTGAPRGPEPETPLPPVAMVATPAQVPGRWLMGGLSVGFVILAAILVWKWEPVRRLAWRPAAEVQLARRWILVADFEGPMDDPDLARAARALVSVGLDQSRVVATVPPEQVKVVLLQAGKPDTARLTPMLARELAYRSSVRTILAGQLHRLGEGYSLILRVLDVERDSLIVAMDERARSPDDLIPATERITRRLRRALGERRDGIQATRPMNLVATPSFEAYRKLVQSRTVVSRGRFPDNFHAGIRLLREALALDPDFAEAYFVMAGHFGSLGLPDSATWAFDQAVRRPERHSEIASLRFPGDLARMRGDFASALTIYDAILARDSTQSGVWNARMGVMMATGRLEEGRHSQEQAIRWRAFGPHPSEFHNLFIISMKLGDARRAAAALDRLPANDLTREYASIWLAHAGGRWSQAESLATVLYTRRGAGAFSRWQAARTLAGEHAARGQVADAAQWLTRARATRMSVEGAEPGRLEERAQILLAYASGLDVLPPAPVFGADTTAALISMGLRSASLGDTIDAKRKLAMLHARPEADRARHGAGPAVLEAFVAHRTGRWADAVRALQPLAREEDEWGQVRDRVGRQWPRWLMAEAWERLGRADSAAAYYELATSRGQTIWFGEPRMVSGLARHRLVMLNARTGRVAEAERHWRVLSETFTHPDPVLARLLDEARSALMAARSMEGAARR